MVVNVGPMHRIGCESIPRIDYESVVTASQLNLRGTTHSIQHNRSIHGIDPTMELDVKSRCWIVTFAWTDADAPTEAVVPTELNYTKAQLKHSVPNASCSIWLEFDGQQRCSRIVNAFRDRDAVVVKRTTRYEFDSWRSVPFTTELEIVRPSGTCINRGKAPVESTPSGPSGTDSVVPTQSDSESDVEFTVLLKRRKQLKRKLKDVRVIELELTQVNAKLARKLTT